MVDLFATQAILPSLAMHYGVSPSAMGVAVNASTFGMAASGLGVALFSARINRRAGHRVALLLLCIPTVLLAHAPDLTTFTLLRVCQGVLMAAAFTLTLAHLGERCTARAAAGAFAAYITGNVASNLVGRLVAAGLVDNFGLATNFYVFAALNAAGGVLVLFHHPQRAEHGRADDAACALDGVRSAPRQPRAAHRVRDRLFHSVLVHRRLHLRQLRARARAVQHRDDEPGVGLFRLPARRSSQRRSLGAVVQAFGARTAIWFGSSVAMLSLPLLLARSLPLVLAGMALAAVGTFFAQAVATGFVSRAAQR